VSSSIPHHRRVLILKAITSMFAKAAAFSLAGGILLSIAGLAISNPSGGPAHDYPFKPVPFTAVHMTDAFWAPRIETNRKVTIPCAFKECEITGRVANFVRAAEALRGQLGANDRKLPGYPSMIPTFIRWLRARVTRSAFTPIRSWTHMWTA